MNIKNELIEVKGNKFFNKYLPYIGSFFPLTGIIIFTNQNPILKNIGIVFLILLLVFSIGILTIGRNKWLKINKEVI